MALVLQPKAKTMARKSRQKAKTEIEEKLKSLKIHPEPLYEDYTKLRMIKPIFNRKLQNGHKNL